MARTFNCGIGMVLVVAEKNAREVLRELKSSEEDPVLIGVLRDRESSNSEEQVILRNLNSWN